MPRRGTFYHRERPFFVDFRSVVQVIFWLPVSKNPARFALTLPMQLTPLSRSCGEMSMGYLYRIIEVSESYSSNPQEY